MRVQQQAAMREGTRAHGLPVPNLGGEFKHVHFTVLICD